MYKVIEPFYDLHDGIKTKDGEIFHLYEVGHIYPRDGFETTQTRIAELAGADNKQGKPLIAEVTDEGQDKVTAEVTDGMSDNKKKAAKKGTK